jgi:WD40 repeat protein
MSLDTRIHDHLHDTGTRIIPRPPDFHRVVRRGRRRRSARAIGYGLAVVALALGVGAIISRLPGAEPPISGNAVPENGWIAYSSAGPGHTGDIWVVKEGVEARRIVGSDDDGLHQACPVFSPDGTKLAYAQSGTPEEPYDSSTSEARARRFVVVAAVDDNGGLSEELLRIEVPEGNGSACPDWSPDGLRLTHSGGPGVPIVSLDGEEESIPAEMYLPRVFQWSPTGMDIAVLAADGIWLVPVEGGEPFLFAPSESLGDPVPDDDFAPARDYQRISWSSDGSELVASFIDSLDPIDVDMQGSFGRLPIDQPGVTIDVTEGVEAVVSPDGRRIAFLQSDSAADVKVLDLESGAISSVELVDPAAGVWGLDWSPDGSRLVVNEAMAGISSADGPFALVSAGLEPGSGAVVVAGPNSELEWAGNGGRGITWQPVYP